MYTNPLRRGVKTLPTLLLLTLTITACDNGDDPTTVPVVTTTAITNITTTSATGGGEITSDGNAAITTKGLVYSSTNANPTTADSKTEETTSTNTFISNLEGLETGTTYHVRAYATNSAGTSYGVTVDFMTGNAAPTAGGITIEGTVEVAQELIAKYTFDDSDDDLEGSSTFQWYVSSNDAGSDEAPIEGATDLTYTPVPAQELKYLRFGITPKSLTGTSPGIETKSSFIGPIAESTTTITFTYDKEEVTYGIIKSSTTGRIWMDRNLGALRAATYLQDHLAYGDLFQWGRNADGHQLINWTQDVLAGSSAPVNSTTNVLSTSDKPGHGNFIIVDSFVSDWSDPQNNNRWQAPNYINNPCPLEWHIPSTEEWTAENIDVFERNQLKIAAAGSRSPSSGAFYSGSGAPGKRGVYWSSTGAQSSDSYYYDTFQFSIKTDGSFFVAWALVPNQYAAFGFSCRCIKDSEN